MTLRAGAAGLHAASFSIPVQSPAFAKPPELCARLCVAVAADPVQLGQNSQPCGASRLTSRLTLTALAHDQPLVPDGSCKGVLHRIANDLRAG